MLDIQVKIKQKYSKQNRVDSVEIRTLLTAGKQHKNTVQTDRHVGGGPSLLIGGEQMSFKGWKTQHGAVRRM